jgi:DNA-binding LacI/PurR family transcriptional regulator
MATGIKEYWIVNIDSKEVYIYTFNDGDIESMNSFKGTDKVESPTFKTLEIPFIVVDSHQISSDILSVSADYYEASRMATKYLISIGHVSIAFIGTNLLPFFGNQTFSGFKKVIEENRISIPINWIQLDAIDEKSSYSCMKNILSYDTLPTALVCSADIYTIGAMRCLKDNGIKIPDDISIIGIDDILLSQYVDPPLTTIKIDKVQMGKIAIDLLVEKIENNDVTNHIINTNDLIIRDSTKPR